MKGELLCRRFNQVGGSGVQQPGMQGVLPRAEADAPAELRGARPSAGTYAGRVILGIFTLGISEGIRALVHHARAGEAPAPRVAGEHLPPAPPRADAFNRGLAAMGWARERCLRPIRRRSVKPLPICAHVSARIFFPKA